MPTSALANSSASGKRGGLCQLQAPWDGQAWGQQNKHTIGRLAQCRRRWGMRARAWERTVGSFSSVCLPVLLLPAAGWRVLPKGCRRCARCRKLYSASQGLVASIFYAAQVGLGLLPLAFPFVPNSVLRSIDLPLCPRPEAHLPHNRIGDLAQLWSPGRERLHACPRWLACPCRWPGASSSSSRSTCPRSPFPAPT